MKAKVINTSESVIYDGHVYRYGDEFEIDDAVGKSLITRGYIEGVTDNADLFEDEEVVDLNPNFEEMSYDELKAYAGELGLSKKGSKDVLIDRIKDFLEEVEEVESVEEETEFEESEESDELPDTSMPE